MRRLLPSVSLLRRTRDQRRPSWGPRRRGDLPRDKPVASLAQQARLGLRLESSREPTCGSDPRVWWLERGSKTQITLQALSLQLCGASPKTCKGRGLLPRPWHALGACPTRFAHKRISRLAKQRPLGPLWPCRPSCAARTDGLRLSSGRTASTPLQPPCRPQTLPGATCAAWGPSKA